MKAIDVIKRYRKSIPLPALDWVEDLTVDDAIDTCPCGEWLIWIATKVNLDKKMIVLSRAICTEAILHLMKDERSICHLQSMYKYSTGELNDEELGVSACFASDAVAGLKPLSIDYFVATSVGTTSDVGSVSQIPKILALAAEYPINPHYVLTQARLTTANVCREVFGDRLKLMIR